jgi:hypothetical protein
LRPTRNLRRACIFKAVLLALGVLRAAHFFCTDKNRNTQREEQNAKGKETKADREQREWQEKKDARTREHRYFGRRVHFKDQPYVWKSMESFRARRKNYGNRALCEFRPYNGAKFITKDQAEVTCKNCLLLIQEHADWKGFPKPTKEEKERLHTRSLLGLLPWGCGIRSLKYGRGYSVTVRLANEETVKWLGEILSGKQPKPVGTFAGETGLEVVAKSA